MRLGLKFVLALVLFMCWIAQASANTQSLVSDEISMSWFNANDSIKIKKLSCGNAAAHFAVESSPFFFRLNYKKRNAIYVLLETYIWSQSPPGNSYIKLILESMDSADRIEVVISKSEENTAVVSIFSFGQSLDFPCPELAYRIKGMPRPLSDYF